ncbi:uncharacterized protein C2orf74 homolog [Psammomys obesus]|uniref:uncharacterized protein C2orf74 homolog n=1 Tax=Psammomys obesus TaxID=48139 RepID=UPI0024532965|nr:uncharacterized protein C2orf74 homolog [Psammomys obesus]
MPHLSCLSQRRYECFDFPGCRSSFPTSVPSHTVLRGDDTKLFSSGVRQPLVSEVWTVAQQRGPLHLLGSRHLVMDLSVSRVDQLSAHRLAAVRSVDPSQLRSANSDVLKKLEAQPLDVPMASNEEALQHSRGRASEIGGTPQSRQTCIEVQSWAQTSTSSVSLHSRTTSLKIARRCTLGSRRAGPWGCFRLLRGQRGPSRPLSAAGLEARLRPPASHTHPRVSPAQSREHAHQAVGARGRLTNRGGSASPLLQRRLRTAERPRLASRDGPEPGGPTAARPGPVPPEIVPSWKRAAPEPRGPPFQCYRAKGALPIAKAQHDPAAKTAPAFPHKEAARGYPRTRWSPRGEKESHRLGGKETSETKCFRLKTNEEPVKPPCTDENEGEDCLAANAEMNKPEDQDKALMHYGNNMPVRPGILVQRQSKDVVATLLRDNTRAEENKDKWTTEPENTRPTTHEGELDEKTPPHFHRTTSAADQKRPLKGVTFSKEVIVVDLGNEYAVPRTYAREHKERKRRAVRETEPLTSNH